jgi:hypothetical protein
VKAADAAHNDRMLVSAALAASIALAPPAARPTAPASPRHPIGLLPGSRLLPPATLAALRGDAERLSISLPDPDGTPLELELVRTRPLPEGIRIEIAGRPRGSRTLDAATLELDAWRGTVVGEPGSRAFLLASPELAGGVIRLGADERSTRTLFLSTGPVGRGLPATIWEPARTPGLPAGEWSCTLLDPPAPDGGIAGTSGGGTPCREIDVAIETDLEFTANLFGGSVAAATAYAALLVGATGEILTLDANVRLRMTYLRLWEGDDPWTQGSTADQLFEFRDHWIANMGEVDRDEAHFISGRGLGGGVAWLPGLCGDFSYALSANLGGSFPYPLVDRSHANWDIFVFAHETGHNFAAPHTHQVSPPLDGCGNGDCSDAANGTIMSYCHGCGGGMSNINLRFHPVNATQMREFLAGVPCDYGDAAGAAVAVDDAATGLGPAPIEVRPLENDRAASCAPVSLATFAATTVAGGSVTRDGDSLVVSPPPGFAGSDSFTYTIVDANGSADVGQVFLEVRPVLAATPVVGASPDLDVAWYDLAPGTAWLPDFGSLAPYAVSTATTVAFESTGGFFADSGRADYFGATFTGWIELPTTALWTIHCESDDGSRVWIDGQLVVDNDGLHGMVDRSGTLALAAGRHPIRIHFFENGGGAGLILRASAAGHPLAVVPASWLSRGGTVGIPGDVNGDGSVGPIDLGMILGGWGSADRALDLNGDGSVGPEDLTIVLGNWTGG